MKLPSVVHNRLFSVHFYFASYIEMNIENHACDPHKCGYPQAIGGYGRLPPSFFVGAVITTAQEYKQSLTEKKE